MFLKIRPIVTITDDVVEQIVRGVDDAVLFFSDDVRQNEVRFGFHESDFRT